LEVVLIWNSGSGLRNRTAFTLAEVRALFDVNTCKSYCIRL